MVENVRYRYLTEIYHSFLKLLVYFPVFAFIVNYFTLEMHMTK